MDEALKTEWPAMDTDRRLAEAARRERPRLRNFIRKRVTNPADAEDILQDVFYELVETYRLIKPIDELTAWLFRVARNRIIDFFRSKQREIQRCSPGDSKREKRSMVTAEGYLSWTNDGPEEAFAHSVLFEELADALEDLPEEQRDVFLAHELMGYSFKEIAVESGVSVNTLLSRKHRAVIRLRERLRWIYEEFEGL
jgi:RNA polymerase sigma factor (sigma-70 family)